MENQDSTALINKIGSPVKLPPPQSNKVVMVTGGAGFLGQHVVKLLQERADDVKEIRVFDLQPYQNVLGHEEKKPVRSYVGDVRNVEELREAFQGVDAVFHTAGLISFGTFPDTAKMKEINTKGTENVVRACIDENVGRLVHTSTVDVVVGYEDIVNGDESLPRPPKLLYPGYGGTKADAERIVLQANGQRLSAGGAALRTLSLRPNVMFGEGDPFYVVAALENAAKNGGVFTRVGSGEAKFQQAYVGNVAWAHVVANATMARDPRVSGHAYFITDDTPVMNTFDFVEPFLESHGYSLSSSSIPSSVLYWGLRIMEIGATIFRPFKEISLPATSNSVLYINKTFYFKRTKAERVLGYKPLFRYRACMDNAKKYYDNLKYD